MGSIEPGENVHNETSERPLDARLGGYDGIAVIVDDIFARMRVDARFARFGTGRSIDSKNRAPTVDRGSNLLAQRWAVLLQSFPSFPGQVARRGTFTYNKGF